jgi:hypothetical protein
MRQSASLPSIRGRPELGSYPFLDHNLCNVSAVQERLRDAQLQRRREKLCRVEASRVERATQRIKWGGIKADSDARAARRSAALAQQVLETRSRISVQLAIMKSSLREEQAQLLAPIQDMADAHEEACYVRRSVARERVVMAASKVAAICDAAASQVRQELVARSRLRHSMIESDRMHAEAIAAAEGRGPRRERIQPKGLTAEDGWAHRQARRQAAAEQAEAATRLQAAIRGKNERRCSLRVRAAVQRRITAEVQLAGATDELAAAEKAATAERALELAQVAEWRRHAHSSTRMNRTIEAEEQAAMTRVEEADALVHAMEARVEEARAKVKAATALEESLASADEEERRRRAAEALAEAARAEAEAAKEAAILAEMEELRVLDLMAQRKRTDAKRKELNAEIERTKAHLAEQTRRRMKEEATKAEAKAGAKAVLDASTEQAHAEMRPWTRTGSAEEPTCPIGIAAQMRERRVQLEPGLGPTRRRVQLEDAYAAQSPIGREPGLDPTRSKKKGINKDKLALPGLNKDRARTGKGGQGEPPPVTASL